MKTIPVSALILFHLLFSLNALFGQIKLEWINQDTLSLPPSSLSFKVSGINEGTVDYQIRLADRPEMAPLVSGSVTVIDGIGWISYTPTFPCFVLCQVSADGQSTQTGAAFQGYQIAPSETEPDDFDAFWVAQKAVLAQIPLDPVVQQIDQQTYFKSYSINFALPDNRRCYGYICIPEGQGPFPAIIQLPAYGFSANIVDIPAQMAERGGAIAMSLNIHNNPPNQSGPTEYILPGAEDPNSNYYKYAILSVIRSIDYLETRPDYNGETGIWGISQGGGLSMLAAGIEPRIKALASTAAALCEHAGLKYNKPSGFPYYFATGGDNIIPAVKYYDAAYAVKRFQGPSLTAIGYEDDVCPPATSMAAFNALEGEKTLLHLLKNKHNPTPEEFANPGHFNGLYSFFRTHFVKMQSPPWPWSETPVGYKISIDQAGMAAPNESIELKAKVFLNGQEMTHWPGAWSLVSGPGSAIFETPESLETKVVLDQPGIYQFQYASIDQDYWTAQPDRYYRISKQVKIVVNPASNLDTLGPQILLQSASNFVSDTFEVVLQVSEPSTGLSLDDIASSRCEVIDLQAVAEGFRLLVKPLSKGKMQLMIPAATTTDLAGNPNAASNILEVQYIPPLSLYQLKH